MSRPPDDNAAAEPDRRAWSATRRVAEMTAGIILMTVGPIVGGPLIPGPLGFVAFAMGLALVLRNSRRARKLYIRWKRRYPRAARWLDLGLRRRKRRAEAFDGNGEQRQQDKPEDRQQDLRLQE
jgi:UPF0716 family protein affecting phage T7 exclusion